MGKANADGAGRLTAGLASGALVGLLILDLNLPTIVSFWGDLSFLVPAAAVIGVLLWLTPLRRLVAAAAVALVLLWLATAYTPLVPWLIRHSRRMRSACSARGSRRTASRRARR